MGAILSSPLNDFVFPFGAANILRQLPGLVRTGRPPADFSLMIEAVCIAEAARAAHLAAGGVALDQDTVQQLLRLR
jgi:hypothetical protein